MYIVMLWILFYYSLLLIAIIYFENLNIKIQYAANNPGVCVWVWSKRVTSISLMHLFVCL